MIAILYATREISVSISICPFISFGSQRIYKKNVFELP